MKVTVDNSALDDDTVLLLERSDNAGHIYVQIAHDDGSGSTILVRASDVAAAIKAFI
jgi:hypothetical protein